jgi:hypothetical protein
MFFPRDGGAAPRKKNDFFLNYFRPKLVIIYGAVRESSAYRAQ